MRTTSNSKNDRAVSNGRGRSDRVNVTHRRRIRVTECPVCGDTYFRGAMCECCEHVVRKCAERKGTMAALKREISARRVAFGKRG